MRKTESNQDPRKPYEPPKLTRVHVDPQQELLQATNCAFHFGDNQTCNNSPGA